jgi:hypothetical protein
LNGRSHPNGKFKTERRVIVRIIEMIVSTQGETTVQTKGFAGAECLEASRWLEQALGLVAADTMTVEFHQQPAAAQSLEHQE